MQKLICAYKFQQSADDFLPHSKIVLRKRKGATLPLPQLIGVDSDNITDELGTRSIFNYKAPPKRRAYTLTQREADLIAVANPGTRPPNALEDVHPWLPKQRYWNNSATSFQVLQKVLKNYSAHLFDTTAACDDHWNRICNAIREKSTLDARFYSAWHLPIQDAYILEERRPNRSIVALDFNGMYLACMQYRFPDPSQLKLIKIEREFLNQEHLPIGLYRCIIEDPLSDFILEHNPFRTFYSGRHLRTRLNEPIEIDLNDFEVTFYKKHFRKIWLIDAVISDKWIAHPLAKEATRSYSRRKNYERQTNNVLANREKYLATLMTSCAQRPTKRVRQFATRERAFEFLESNFGISPSPDESETATNIWLQSRKGIAAFTQSDGSTSVLIPSTRDGSACFSLGQRIVARGRIALLEMMEKILLNAPNAAICYTNIDSIHFSLPAKHLAEVLTWLNSERSDALGSFKIEAVSKHGLWLEPGRYWLYSERIEKFRNRSIGNRIHPFDDHRTHITNRKLNDLHFPIKITLRMDRSMSTSRLLRPATSDGLIRQRLIEVGKETTTTEIHSQFERARLKDNLTRMDAFERLRKEMESSGAAASEPEEEPNNL